MEDLREQLLQIKKAHTLALRDNAQCRTRLRIAERECKRRETEIQRLLSMPSWQTSTTAGGGGGSGGRGGPSPETRLELAALRRKLILYERMLHEKSQENAKLMTDKSVVQASEARKQMEKLETECQRLRTHLAQSVPESEFLREKEQYLAIINRLVEENMHLRQIIGDFEHRRRESEKLLTQLGGGEALVRQFRHSSISSRKQAKYYKNALGNLLKGQQRPAGILIRGRTESMGSSTLFTTTTSIVGKNGGINEGKLRDILDKRKMKEPFEMMRRRRASLGGSETLEEEEEERKEEMGMKRKENGKMKNEEGGNSRKLGNHQRKKKEAKGEEEDEEGDGLMKRKEPPMKMSATQRSMEEKNKSNGQSRPRSASNPENGIMPTAGLGNPNGGQIEEEKEGGNGGPMGLESNGSGASTNRENEEEGEEMEVIRREEQMAMEEEEEGHDNEEEEEEEDGQLVDGAEEPEDMETHLTALYRVLHSHVLRQQMAKVRHEREPPPAAMVGMLHLFLINGTWPKAQTQISMQLICWMLPPLNDQQFPK